jgi:hypothetical protein
MCWIFWYHGSELGLRARGVNVAAFQLDRSAWFPERFFDAALDMQSLSSSKMLVSVRISIG